MPSKLTRLNPLKQVKSFGHDELENVDDLEWIRLNPLKQVKSFGLDESTMPNLLVDKS